MQFTIPFIAITGSNGKTTTKELLHAVLSKSFETYTTEGNLNNHIGVPLTILKIKEDAEIAVAVPLGIVDQAVPFVQVDHLSRRFDVHPASAWVALNGVVEREVQ